MLIMYVKIKKSKIARIYVHYVYDMKTVPLYICMYFAHFVSQNLIFFLKYGQRSWTLHIVDTVLYMDLIHICIILVFASNTMSKIAKLQ